MARKKAPEDFAAVFARLRKILAASAGAQVVTKDTPKAFYLEMKKTGAFFDSLPEKQKKKPIMFGATILGKAYVSYHLVPIYLFPDLLEGISPELAKRRQGKGCFNFSAVDEGLFKELAALTKKGAAACRTRPCRAPGSC